jgi:hypothetical protein
MLDPLIIKTIAVGLGLMFLLAGYHKLAEAAQFRVTLLEYQVIPESLVAPISRIVPIIEILLGGAWLVGYYQAGLTATASALLLGVYALAISINIYRGRVHFDCGCGFGGKSENEQFLSGGLVLRNVLLIVAALATLMPATSRELGFSDYLTLIVALLAMTLLFGAANQLLANRAAINTWRKGNG